MVEFLHKLCSDEQEDIRRYWIEAFKETRAINCLAKIMLDDAINLPKMLAFLDGQLAMSSILKIIGYSAQSQWTGPAASAPPTGVADEHYLPLPPVELVSGCMRVIGSLPRRKPERQPMHSGAGSEDQRTLTKSHDVQNTIARVCLRLIRMAAGSDASAFDAFKEACWAGASKGSDAIRELCCVRTELDATHRQLVRSI